MKKAPQGAFFIARAHRADRFARMDVNYRWMNDADVDALSALAARIWRAHYPSLISHAQIDYMLARTYTPDALKKQMAQGERFLLAEHDGAMIGYISGRPLAAIENPILRGDAPCGADDYFLHKCYLLPALHSRGLGKALLRELVMRLEAKRIRLQVHRENRDSWNFYLKQGFSIIGQADFPIGDGYVMTDYVMERTA